MKSNHEIKCPECNATLKIDDANHASIINQVRDQLFEEQLTKRVNAEVDSAVKIKENELKIHFQKILNSKGKRTSEKSSFSKTKSQCLEAFRFT